MEKFDLDVALEKSKLHEWAPEAIDAYKKDALKKGRPVSRLYWFRIPIEIWVTSLTIAAGLSAFTFAVGLVIWLVWAVISVEGLNLLPASWMPWLDWASHILLKWSLPAIGLAILNEELLIGRHILGPPEWSSYKLSQTGGLGWLSNKRAVKIGESARNKGATVVLHELKQYHKVVKDDCLGGRPADIAAVIEVDGRFICVMEGGKTVEPPDRQKGRTS